MNVLQPDFIIIEPYTDKKDYINVYLAGPSFVILDHKPKRPDNGLTQEENISCLLSELQTDETLDEFWQTSKDFYQMIIEIGEKMRLC